MTRDRAAGLLALVTGLIGLVLVVAGWMWQNGGEEDGAGLADVAAVGVAYTGLITAALGGALAMRRAKRPSLRQACACQVVLAALASLVIVFRVVSR
jgi:drug/metabolite transporter (DMT)-like permease